MERQRCGGTAVPIGPPLLLREVQLFLVTVCWLLYDAKIDTWTTRADQGGETCPSLITWDCSPFQD